MSSIVLAVLVSAIDASAGAQAGVEDVDARDKPAHDEVERPAGRSTGSPRRLAEAREDNAWFAGKTSQAPPTAAGKLPSSGRL
jgi:hypothetical protein